MRYSFFINTALTLALVLVILQGSMISWIIPLEAFLVAWGAAPKSETAELKALVETSQLKVLEEENRTLQKMLRLSSVVTPSLIAPVLGYELGQTTHIVLGKGSKDGVALGDAVVTSEGVLLGTILTVHASTSLVRTILDPQAKFSGAILQENAAVNGVIEGVHGVGLRLFLIPRQAVVAVGDLVVTAGEEVGVPRGIPVARVAAVSETPGIPLQEAILNPLASFHDLIALAVVTSEHKE